MQTTDLSPLSAPGVVTREALRPEVGQGIRAPRPPRGIYLPHGPVSNTRFGTLLPPTGGRTVAQRLGLAYELKVQDVLREIYADKFFCSVPFLFEDRKGLHRCIPDGVLRINDVSVVIIEIKLRHSERAWWQLERLYTPVLRSMLGPHARIFRAEICRSYDPDERFGLHSHSTSLHKLPSDQVGVLQWKL